MLNPAYEIYLTDLFKQLGINVEKGQARNLLIGKKISITEIDFEVFNGNKLLLVIEVILLYSIYYKFCLSFSLLNLS